MNMSSSAFQIIYCMESSTDVIKAAQSVSNSEGRECFTADYFTAELDVFFLHCL